VFLVAGRVFSINLRGVNHNFSLAALGFLASKEVKREGLGNFGLYDRQFISAYCGS